MLLIFIYIVVEDWTIPQSLLYNSIQKRPRVTSNTSQNTKKAEAFEPRENMCLQI